MPELNLFGRRWHVSTDTFPILTTFLAVVHIGYVIPFLTGTYSIESTGIKNGCDVGTSLRVAVYGMFAIYLCAAVLEASITAIGLKGGPLDERKRRPMRPLLYLEVALWILLVAWTTYATYIIRGPNIDSECWSDNPCAYSDELPLSCTGNPGNEVLTPSCASILNNQTAAEQCLNWWTSQGLATLTLMNATGNSNPYDFTCLAVNELAIPIAEDLAADAGGSSPADGGSKERVDSFNEALEELRSLSQNFMSYILELLGIPVNGTSAGRLAPWYRCMNDSCQAMVADMDDCQQWDVLLRLPDPSNRKTFFEGLVWGSWAVLGVTALAVLVVFNSFPDEDDAGWEGSIKSLSCLLCCDGVLQAAETGTGSSASKEIASSLRMLFGGMDLDPTDRLFAAILVAELQAERRRQHVARRLEEEGVVAKRSRRGALVKRRVAGFGGGHRLLREASAPLSPRDPSSSRELAAQRAASSQDWPSGHLSPPAWRQAASWNSPSAPEPISGVVPLAQRRPKPGAEALPAPVARSGDSSQSLVVSRTDLSSLALDGARAAEALNPARVIPLYRHAILALRSDVLRRGVEDIPEGEEEGGESEGEDPSAGSGVKEQGLVVEAQGGSGSTVSGSGKGPRLAKLHLSPRSGADSESPFANKGPGEAPAAFPPGSMLRVLDRYHPMLTPTGLPPRLRKLISARAATAAYAGFQAPVAPEDVRTARGMARFAVASYGLQAALWAKGRPPPACLGQANRVLRCFKLCGAATALVARNVAAIAEITEGKREHLLRASYANAPGGIIPYLVAECPRRKAIIVSVRGTVSMEDLITDLLSNPVDVGDWMPKWVHAANKDGKPLLAHAGIVASATAVLRDIEACGLLREMLAASLKRRAAAKEAKAGGATEDGATEVGATKDGATKAPSSADSSGAAASSLDAAPRQAEAMGRGGLAEAFAGGPSASPAPPALSEASSSQAQPQARVEEESGTLRLDGKEAAARARRIVRDRLEREGWRVIVTGHSLGAAVACMLSFHLKQHLEDLECWAFCPPGGLMSWNLSRIAGTFCTSVVVGKDVISRLSFSNLKRVVDEMVLALARCRRPKLAILADVMLKRRGKNRVPPDTFCPVDEMSDEALLALERYHQESYLHQSSPPEMYPPGNIIFLRPFKGAGKDAEWDAVWVDAAVLMGEGILLAPSMLSSHRLFSLTAALDLVLDEIEKPQDKDEVDNAGIL